MIFSIKSLNIKHPTTDGFLIKDFNLEIGKGELALLIGESGSGKTTIIKSILNFKNELFISGDINYFGNNKFNSKVFAKDISYIPQDYPLFDEVKVYENVEASFKNSLNYFKQLYPEFNFNKINIDDNLQLSKQINKIIKKSKIQKDESNLDKEISRIFKKLNLNYEEIKNKKPSKLSGGQKQRVSIACALLKKPSLIIMDEPFANLDQKTSYLIMEFINELREEGISFLISTHDVDIVEGNEDSAYLLSGNGKWITSQIHEMKKEKSKEWVTSYFTPFYNVIDGDVYLYEEIKIIKTKLDSVVKTVIPWKGEYKINVELKDRNVISTFTKEKYKVGDKVGVEYAKK